MWAAGLHQDTSSSARGAQTRCLQEVTWIPHELRGAQLALGFLALDISKATGSITQPCINDGASSEPPRDNGDTPGRTFTWQDPLG